MTARSESIAIDIDDEQMSGTFLSPKSKVPGVLFVHGWGGSQERDLERAKGIAGLGCVCLTFDLREQQARARDLPRNRIIREHSLWPLAKSQPDNLAALGKIEDMHPRTVRQDGQFLLDLIKRAGSVPMDQWPPAVAEPLPVDAAALIKQLRAIGQAEAERLEMAPELMLRKKTLEALVKSGYPDGPYQLPDSLRGWRRELMGQALLDSLASAGEQP